MYGAVMAPPFSSWRKLPAGGDEGLFRGHEGVPLLPTCSTRPLLLWLGVLFVLSVYYFPTASSASCGPAQERRDKMSPASVTSSARAARSTTPNGARASGTVIAWHGLARTGATWTRSRRTCPPVRVICPIPSAAAFPSGVPRRKRSIARVLGRIAVSLMDSWACAKRTGSALPWGRARHPARRRRAEGPHPAPGTERHRTKLASCGRAHPDLCGAPARFDRVGDLEKYFAPSTALAGSRTNNAQAHGDLDPPHRRRQGDAALRPEDVLQFTHHRTTTTSGPWTRSTCHAVPARRDLDCCCRGRRGDALARTARGGGDHSGCGHAPALNVPDQLALVERFLTAG